jgi:hypothetical protein
MQPTRKDLEQRYLAMQFAEDIGLDPEAVRQDYQRVWDARDTQQEEAELTDRQIAQVLTQGATDHSAGKALRGLGIDISNEQAEEYLNLAQMQGKAREVVGKLLSMPRIDPQEQDYQDTIEGMVQARKGRALKEETTSWTATIEPIEE